MQKESESESEVAQSCPTLSDPMDCNLSGSSVHGIFQAIALEWIAISPVIFGCSYEFPFEETTKQDPTTLIILIQPE